MKFFAPRFLASTASLAALVALATTGAGCSSSGAESELGVAQSALIARPAARLFLSANVLTRLKARAAAGDAAWTALKAQCDGLAGATMNPPNGTAYPNSPDVGQGYQGEEYVSPTMALGLCYRVTSGTDDTAAARYGAAGDRLLAAISTPGAQSPSTDSGYGIRNYGFSMAVGYDWLYPALSSSTRSQVISTLNAWIDWYDTSGFIKNDPIGNYFIGYFLAKTTGALATEGDNPKAAQYWDDVQNRMWGTLVKPAFTKSMAGGGWPEGWEYGPRSVRGLVETLWAVKTAHGVDWLSELPQVKDQSNYLTYFAWPSLQHMDDTGTVRSGTTIAPSAALVSSLAMIAEYNGDTATAANARGFAADVIQNGKDDRQPWQKFLYWDDSLAKSSYTSRPLSYVATGPGHVAMRSTWAKDATWGTLMSGTYINAGDSGEQLFNQGSLAVVRGDQPVIVNASGWIPQVAGTTGENFVYDDSWGSHTRRLYNSFFVADSDNHYSPGQSSTGPDAASTHVEKVDELGGVVRARAANIEQMYRSNSGAAGSPVSQFNRDLVYLRPGTFVLYDRTTIAHPASDSWIAFHTPSAPATGAVSDATQRRFDVGTLGSVRTLLPRNAATNVVSLPGGVARIEAHDPAHAGTQDWLTVVTATDAAPDQVRLSSSDGNVAAGNVVGVHVKASRQQVVLFPAGHAPSSTTTSAKYTVQQSGDADHVLVDMAPGSYAVTTTVSGGAITVDVHAGGSMQPTANGTLAFTVSASGSVSGAAAPVTTPTTTPSTPSPTPTPVTAPTSAPVVSPTPAPTSTTPDPTPTPSSDPSGTPTPTPSGSTGTGTTAGTNTTDSAAVIALPSYVTRSSSFVQGVDGYAGARDFSISTVDRQWNPEGHTYAGVDRLYSYETTVGQYTAKSLLSFDVSSIPASSVVKSATLEVTVESWVNGLSLVGDYVTTPWSGTRAPGWIHASDTVAWATPGVGASDVAGKAFTIGGLTSAGLQRKTIALDTATVQAWVANPSNNHGFVITNPKADGILRIVSSEAPVASQRPKLTIEYAGQ